MFDSVLNMPWVMNITGFGMCHGSEHASSSEYVRALDTPFSQYKKNFLTKI